MNSDLFFESAQFKSSAKRDKKHAAELATATTAAEAAEKALKDKEATLEKATDEEKTVALADFKIAKKAKKGSRDKIEKYGFWGLIFFVMLPIPGTGVYAGSIAAYIFKFKKRKAFLANAIGIFFSCVIMSVSTYLAMNGVTWF